jgi:hypothetical protein
MCRRAGDFLRDDAGLALATVVLISALLFLLATSVLTLVAFRQTQTSHYTARTQAMHIADAGVNEFLYQLSEDYGYWKDPANPTVGRTVGPVQMDGGTWRVVATAPTNTDPLRLTSVGTLVNGQKRTITATVRFPTFADYVMFVNASQSIGAGATFYGRFRSNGTISNSGVITGLAEAGGSCNWSTSAAVNYPGGYKNNVTIEDFSQLTTDLNKIKSAASASGSYYTLSGALGHKIVLSGSQATVYKVTAVNNKYPRSTSTTDKPLGELTTTLVGTLVIPSDGVVYFEDNVWVMGDYSANITIASNKDIYIPDDLVLTTEDSNVTCGLVAASDIVFPYWYQTMPTDLYVRAALLGQGGTIVGESAPPSAMQASPYNTYSIMSYVTNTTTPSKSGWTGQYSGTIPKKTSCNVNGATAMLNNSGLSVAFLYRNFAHDPRLQNNPPPLYPQIRDGSLRVDTWLEN